MPIFEYRCQSCEWRFEAFLATSEEKAVCPRCQASDLQRLLSRFSSASRGNQDTSAPPPAPRTGGCGGGCACH